MPINKFIPEIWEEFNVEINDKYTIIWPMRWYPKDETKENKKQKEQKKKMGKEKTELREKILKFILLVAWIFVLICAVRAES